MNLQTVLPPDKEIMKTLRDLFGYAEVYLGGSKATKSFFNSRGRHCDIVPGDLDIFVVFSGSYPASWLMRKILNSLFPEFEVFEGGGSGYKIPTQTKLFQLIAEGKKVDIIMCTGSFDSLFNSISNSLSRLMFKISHNTRHPESGIILVPTRESRTEWQYIEKGICNIYQDEESCSDGHLAKILERARMQGLEIQYRLTKPSEVFRGYSSYFS